MTASLNRNDRLIIQIFISNNRCHKTKDWYLQSSMEINVSLDFDRELKNHARAKCKIKNIFITTNTPSAVYKSWIKSLHKRDTCPRWKLNWSRMQETRTKMATTGKIKCVLSIKKRKAKLRMKLQEMFRKRLFSPFQGKYTCLKCKKNHQKKTNYINYL